MSKLSGCAVMAVVTTLAQLLLLASGNCHAQNQPVEDSAAMFNNFDRDRDGLLSPAEIGGYKWGRYDSNGDGAVSGMSFWPAALLTKRKQPRRGTWKKRSPCLIGMKTAGFQAPSSTANGAGSIRTRITGSIKKNSFAAGQLSLGSLLPLAAAVSRTNPPASAGRQRSLGAKARRDSADGSRQILRPHANGHGSRFPGRQSRQVSAQNRQLSHARARQMCTR